MTEAVELSGAAIADRPGRLGEGLWLHAQRSIRRLAWVDGEWVAYDTRGGEYRQSLFPGGLAASRYQPLGIDNDPRLSERVAWPPPGPVPRHIAPTGREILSLLLCAAVSLGWSARVWFLTLGRHYHARSALFLQYNEGFAAIGTVLGTLGFGFAVVAIARWVGARRSAARQRRMA